MRASILSSVIAPNYGSDATFCRQPVTAVGGSRKPRRPGPGRAPVIEDLVVQPGIDLQLDVGGSHAFDQAPAAVDGDQPVGVAVHYQQRRGQCRRPLRHGLADLQQGPADAGRDLAVVDQRILVVGRHHRGVAGYGLDVEFLHRKAGHEDTEHFGGDRHQRRHQLLSRHGRRRQHHHVVVVRAFDAVGEHDPTAHAVPEHDALEAGVLPGGDADQGVEIAGVLGDVPHQHPLAIGTAVPSVVQGVGDQPRVAEALRDVVVAAGILAEAVRQHDRRSRRGVRRPDVVDDAHAADAVEIPFSAGRTH